MNDDRREKLQRLFTQIEQHMRSMEVDPDAEIYPSGIEFHFDYGLQGQSLWLDIQDISWLASYLAGEANKKADKNPLDEWSEEIGKFTKELMDEFDVASEEMATNYPDPQYDLDWLHGPDSKPHRCPVCDGRGIVPAGFYETTSYGSTAIPMPDNCRTCNGSGVVWS